MKKVLLLNLHASRARKNLQKILNEFDGEIIEIRNTDYIREYYDQALKLKPDAIIIGGGDGTVISCIDYCANKGYKGCYAILPLGTANYLARNLDLPLQWRDALKVVDTGKPKKVSLAEANGKLFSLISDIGITASVSEKVDNKIKRVFGQGAYLMEGFRQLFKHDAFDYKITLDDEKTIHGRCHEIVVFNADVNLQLSVAPPVQLKDESLILTIYGDGNSVIKLLWYTFIFIISLGKLQKGIISFTVKKALIETDPVKIFSSDGEVIEQTPLEVKLSDIRAKIIH